MKTDSEMLDAMIENRWQVDGPKVTIKGETIWQVWSGDVDEVGRSTEGPRAAIENAMDKL